MTTTTRDRSSSTAPPAFTVSSAELRVLARIAQATADPELGGDERQLAAGLVARGLLHRDADGVARLPEGALGGVIEIVVRSHVQLHVRHIVSTGEAPTFAWYALTPIVGVELRETPEGWRIEAFATREVLLRVSRAVALVEREAAGTDSFRVTGADLEQCADRLALGDRSGAEAALTAVDAPPVAVRAFLSALEARSATNAVVRSLPPPADTRIERDSQAFTWFDATDWGLWRVPVPDPDALDLMTVGPITAFGVGVGLAGLLPLADDPGWHDVIVPGGLTPGAGPEDGARDANDLTPT